MEMCSWHENCKENKCPGPGENECTECIDNYYLHGNTCINKDYAIVGFYSDSVSESFKSCHSNCNTCFW